MKTTSILQTQNRLSLVRKQRGARTAFLLIALLSFSLPLSAQQKLSLLFVGDAMQHIPQITAAKTATGYDYKDCFVHIKEEIQAADIAVVNLETTHAGKPFSGYPTFSAPDEFSIDLKDAGFDIFLTANNHCADKGRKGIERTIDVLDSLKVRHTGTFKDSAQYNLHYPLMIVKNGFKLAFLNYTYSTNDMPVYAPNIVNIINDKVILRDVEKAKLYKPDIIIVCLHWGQEYMRLPNNEQKRLAKLLTDNGVKLVIGSHPHVIQPMEAVKNIDGRIEHVTAYSLGNFISNQKDRYTDSGAIVKIELQKDESGETEISDCRYSLVWRYKYTENGKLNYTLIPASIYDNNPEIVQPALRPQMKSAFDDARALLNKHNINVPEEK